MPTATVPPPPYARPADPSRVQQAALKLARKLLEDVPTWEDGGETGHYAIRPCNAQEWLAQEDFSRAEIHHAVAWLIEQSGLAVCPQTNREVAEAKSGAVEFVDVRGRPLDGAELMNLTLLPFDVPNPDDDFTGEPEWDCLKLMPVETALREIVADAPRKDGGTRRGRPNEINRDKFLVALVDAEKFKNVTEAATFYYERVDNAASPKSIVKSIGRRKADK